MSEITETDLVARLRIPRSQLWAARKPMKPGTDWRVEKGDGQTEVIWLASGLEKLRAEKYAADSPEAFQAMLGLTPPSPAEKAAPVGSTAAEPNAWQTLTVVSTRVQNPSLITAQTEGTIPAFRIRVKRQDCFAPGMKILARPQAGTDVWEYGGNPATPAAGPIYPLRPNVWPRHNQQPDHDEP